MKNNLLTKNNGIRVFSFMAAAGLMSAFLPVGLASAAHVETYSYESRVSPLNGSGTRGNFSVEVVGDSATVKLHTDGASPMLPHAQHLHIGGENQCPSPSADTNNDGFISVAEGAPNYGGIKISLTESGDVSPSSGLALDRFPVANANGEVNYERTFTLPENVTAEDLRNAVVVQHGISELFDDTAMYDGEKRSSINQDVPFEATVPAACGELREDSAQRQRDRDVKQMQREMEREERKAEREQARIDRQEERDQRREERKAEREENRNNSSVDVDGDSINISNTGPRSRTSVEITNRNSLSIENNNTVEFGIDNDQDVRSGDATVSGNTSAGQAGSGNADAELGVGATVEQKN